MDCGFMHLFVFLEIWRVMIQVCTCYVSAEQMVELTYEMLTYLRDWNFMTVYALHMFIRHRDETKVTEQLYSPEATFNKIYICIYTIYWGSKKVYNEIVLLSEI
jgi:hypothetical protein